ncbi:MAG: YraN family protein [Clostridia bacterium]|nr:YraN family protein [Clostridia bacterium]
MSFELEIGRIGEDLVARWLKSKGYIILRQNYRCDYGEIDIVAENPKVIAFVEVKTRKENSLVSPKDAVDTAKQRKLAITAKDFVRKAFLKNMPYRFDIAEVTYSLDEDGIPKYSLNYIKNAFFYDLADD